MTPKAIQQRVEAVLSRWRKYRSRNQRKPKTLRNVALLVAGLAAFGSAYLIYTGETSQEIWASEQTKNAKPSVEIIP